MKFNNPIYENEELTYQDVFLFQNYFDGYSRSKVDIKPQFDLWTHIPIISANMNAVTWRRMAETIARYGWLGVLPQDMDINTLTRIIKEVKNANIKYDTAITVKPENTIRDAMWIIQKVTQSCNYGKQWKWTNMNFLRKRYGKFRSIFTALKFEN